LAILEFLNDHATPSHLPIGALGFQHSLGTTRLGAGVGDAVVLAIEAEDEHGAAVHVATGLAGADFRRGVTFRVDIAHSLAKAAAAEFVGAAEEIDGVVRTVGGEASFHGAEMFVT
jgi:hypothetical protein